jgi:hypothetical protein
MSGLIGGDKMARVLAEYGAKFAAGKVKVGFLAGATYPDGESVAQVAFWNEFGTSRIPARPFFRSMIAAESPGWAMKMAKLGGNGADGNAILGLMGEDITGALQQSIIGWSNPGNAPSTIAAKGFDKPLVDTGHMKDSVGWEIVE